MSQTFEEWKKKVDSAVWDKAGLSIDDLEDCPLHDWFEDGESPNGAATLAIRYSGGEG